MIDNPPEATLAELDVIALWALFISFERRLADELVELGVSVSGFRLIGEVMREPGGVRQGELARRLGVRPPTVSAAVARLEKQGLIYRIQDPDDPRARRVCLSPGTSLLPGIDVLARMESAMFGGMTDGEREQARATITTLTQRLEAQ
ncbi:MAG: DNA-binding MarR family transcriptional regulator [Myxococcota bacterium]|jgi:DNA-binding MarR family transcriptional regulator